MLINLDLKTRGVVGELLRREAARLRVTITMKSGSFDGKELIEHAVYLETTADALVSSFESDKTAANVANGDGKP